ncbi:hypothetical protein D3C71_79150 [compost metagenome]
MSTNNLFDLAIVLGAIAGCGLWIWWDERDRKERRRKAEEVLARLAKEREQKEASSVCSPLYQQSDSGGNHSS